MKLYSRIEKGKRTADSDELAATAKTSKKFVSHEERERFPEKNPKFTEHAFPILHTNSAHP